MPRLTVCMIAKNEAPRIALALDSVRSIADQLIVIDTGSTDDTVAIARAHGAEVYHHAWDDDFAAARNAALPHIRGDWVLWIDADERLIPESAQTLPELLARTDALAYGIRRHDYVGGLKPDQPRGPFIASLILRLWRTDQGLKFTGRCHEQCEPWLDEVAKRTGLNIYTCPLTFDHDCDYFFEGRQRKSDRNTRLLEMEVRDRPGRLYFMVQCAAAQLERPESFARGHSLMADVLKLLTEMRDREHAPFGLVMMALEYAANPPDALAADRSLAPLPMSSDEACVLAERWFPNAAPLVWLRARRAFAAGDFEGAIPILRRLLNMGRTHAYDLELPFDPAIVGDDARLNLGVCLLRIAELDEAETIFREIGPASQRYHEAQFNLQAIASIREAYPDDSPAP